MADPLDRSEAAGEINPLPLQELIALDGFRGVNTDQIFGMKFEGDCKHLPPHAKSYLGIGSALQGCPLDSWTRHGMHRNRLPEFSSFDQLTAGLSIDEKVRTVVVLRQYLKDISKRSPDFEDTIFQSETLAHAYTWVCDMLLGVDEDTKDAYAELRNPRYTHQQTETATENGHSTTDAEPLNSTHENTAGRLKRWFKGLIGTPTN